MTRVRRQQSTCYSSTFAGLSDSSLPATLLLQSCFRIQGPRLVCSYVYVPIDAWYIFTKKRKQHPPPGDDASTAEAVFGVVGRDERGEARQANTTPNCGPHLEPGRSRLKTCSISDFSIAETTGPTYLYTYLYIQLNKNKTKGTEINQNSIDTRTSTC